MLVYCMYSLVFKFFYIRGLETFLYQASFSHCQCPFRTKGYREMNQELQELAEVHGKHGVGSWVLLAALC